MKKNLFSLKIAVLMLGMLFSKTASADYIAVASGAWSNPATWGGAAPTATVTGQSIDIPSGITVTLDADVTFSGVLKAFIVNGVLTSTTSNAVIMTDGDLTGAGTISIGKLKFTLLSTSTFAGTLNVKHMTNNIASLLFISTGMISDTLELTSGNMLLNTNANLSMAAGSTVKVDNGALVISSGIFNTSNAYNVMYVGASKTAGIELNTLTLQNAYIRLNNNNEKITLANNTIVNGNLELTTGKLDLDAHKLTLKGNFTAGSGATFRSDNTSDLSIEGSGVINSAFMFESGAALNDLTLNRTGSAQIKLGTGLAIAGHLNLMEGNLSVENGGTLMMNSASVIHVEKGSLSLNSGTFNGSAAYNVEYMGNTDATSGTELSGSGLNHVTINYGSNTTKLTLNNTTSVAGKFELMKGKLDLNGKNLMLNGTLSQSGNAWFIGNGASELHLNLTSVTQDTLLFDNASASSQTLRKLRINTSGMGSVMLGNKLIINDELAFVAGKMELLNADLEMASTAVISGYDDSKYIITSEATSGKLIQNVNAGAAYVIFPVGLSNNYSPAFVQQTSAGTSGNFSVKCHSLYVTPTLKAVNRKWMVEGAGVATINANLKFAWKASEEMNGFDRANAYVSHYTNSAWDVTAASGATVGANTTYELSRGGLTSLSPFAVVENGQPLKVSELSKLTGVELYPNPVKDVVTVKVGGTDEYRYELVDLTGRTVLSLSNANTVNKLDVSSLGSGCYFIKITRLNDNTTDTKRFIKQ